MIKSSSVSLLCSSTVRRSLRLSSHYSTASLKDDDTVVVSYARTPIGKLGGSLATFTAPRLASHAIKAAIERSKLPVNLIEEAFFGNVVSAGVGQAPARQAVIYAGLPLHVASTTINKVCASGMKAIMLASLSIRAGYRQGCIAGGMESMSNIPYYLPGARSGYRLGNKEVVDGLINDGLWDIYNDQHMGNCGEACASAFEISREEQDEFAIMSYARAATAWSSGKFDDEVIPIEILGKRGELGKFVTRDEEFSSIQVEKVKSLKPAFKKEGGTITAANSSKINDGAAAMVIISGKLCKELNLVPLFRIRGFGDAERDPVEFTTAPSDAIPKALLHAGVNLSDIEYHEINEAFAVVPLVNARSITIHSITLHDICLSSQLEISIIFHYRILNLELGKVNVFGGAIALGHPIGCSGARIVGTLYNVLKDRDATLGCASICNGKNLLLFKHSASKCLKF
jgi:acetyl-CoA C-acetyltransferase